MTCTFVGAIPRADHGKPTNLIVPTIVNGELVMEMLPVIGWALDSVGRVLPLIANPDFSAGNHVYLLLPEKTYNKKMFANVSDFTGWVKESIESGGANILTYKQIGVPK